MGAAAGTNQGPFRFFQFPDHFVDLFRITFHRRFIGRHFNAFRIFKFIDLLVLDVNGEVDQHRPLPACVGDVKRFLHDAGHIFRLTDDVTIFYKGLTGAGNVGFLEHIAAHEAAVHLAGNDHQGNAVRISRSDTGDHIGGAGAAGDSHHAYLPRQACIAAGCMARVLVFSRLMMDRIIFLGTQIDDYTANTLQAQLLYLDSVDSGKDISIYINSPGGSVTAGLGIYDTMQFISSDVATICTGMAASMGAVLLVAGTEGKRSALPHSRVMIHQPLGGVQGQASDIEIEAKEILKFKKELYTIISDHSHTPYEKVYADSDRNYWMTAEEAKEYGMIDEVLTRKK